MPSSIKKLSVIVSCLAVGVGLSACSYSSVGEMFGSGNAMATTKTALPPTNPANVSILDTPPLHYRLVGRLSADNYNLVGMEHSQTDIMAELQKQAASLGANAVIRVNQGLAQTTAEAIITK